MLFLEAVQLSYVVVLALLERVWSVETNNVFAGKIVFHVVLFDGFLITAFS